MGGWCGWYVGGCTVPGSGLASINYPQFNLNVLQWRSAAFIASIIIVWITEQKFLLLLWNLSIFNAV